MQFLSEYYGPIVARLVHPWPCSPTAWSIEYGIVQFSNSL